MPYEISSVATPKALFDRIVAAVQDESFMASGNTWQLVFSFDGWGDSNEYQNCVIKSFLVPGPTGTGDYHVVLRIAPSAGTNTTNIMFAAFEDDPTPPWGGETWITRGTWSSASVDYAVGDVVKYSSYYYVCAAAHTSTSTVPSNSAMAGTWYLLGSSPTWMGALLSSANQHSYSGAAKVWSGGTGDIPYWLFANGNRVMFVTRSDSRYHFAYAGGIIRIGSAASYPLPTLLAGNNSALEDTYLDSGNQNFPLTGGTGPSHTVSLSCPGNRTATTTEVYPYPPGAYIAPLAPIARNPAGDFPVMPVLLGYYDGTSTDRGVVGTMDGVFVTDCRGNASENVITVGSDDYICFENVNRGESGHFMALKME